MKKWLCIFFIAISTPLLSGCLDNGSSANPPANMSAIPGDGRVKISWTANSGVDYWLFTATDAALNAFNWTGLANQHVYINAATPFYMCGLLNNTTYYFATNGRINGGPGGASSAQVNATPYNASASWAIPAAASAVPATANLNGVGYASLTTCSNDATSASGRFAAVGTGGAIFTSADNGQSWIARTSPLTTDLYAVTGYAANQNNASTPALRWVAVGAGGASVYSTDGVNWLVGRGNLGNPALRAVTQIAGTFFAAGETGTILSSTDGTTWTPRTSGSTNNLQGITHSSIYAAVGDSGTILTSADGNTWTTRTPTSVPAGISLTGIVLKSVSAIGNIYVAVGDGGTIVTSIDGGATWIARTPLSGTPNLVSVAAESQLVANAVVDPQLGFISHAQFVAIDSSGNAYSSVNGIVWALVAPPAGKTTSTGASGLNALVSSGFGYVAAGNSGATPYAF